MEKQLDEWENSQKELIKKVKRVKNLRNRGIRITSRSISAFTFQVKANVTKEMVKELSEMKGFCPIEELIAISNLNIDKNIIKSLFKTGSDPSLNSPV